MEPLVRSRSPFLHVLRTYKPKSYLLFRFLVLLFENHHTHPAACFWQIEAMQQFYIPENATKFAGSMKRPLVCADCRRFFEGPAECRGCAFQFREVSVSWNYWLWAIYAQVKMQWLRRLLSHDGRAQRVMHPDHSVSAPVFPSIPEMQADEQEIVDEHGGVVQQADGRGAECEDIERVMCQAIAHAHKGGELSSGGRSASDSHIFMWAGDGFMARKRSKWCQLGLILCSRTAMNQSPNDSRFVMSWEGGEDYDVFHIRSENIRPVLQRLAREGVLQDTERVLPHGVGKHVEFAIGGDKP